MSKVVVVLRVLLGLAFLVFGLNGFLHFFAPPPPGMPAAAAFAAALGNSGYVMPLMSAFMVIAAVMLLAGRFVPLAIALLTPILVNIVAFHLFLDPAGTGFGLVLSIMAAVIAWAHRDAYKPMLAAKVEIS